MQPSPVYALMRLHGDFMATGGQRMADADLDRVHAFHDRLREEDAVIEFDPNIPADQGIDGAAGFAFRPRTIDDEDRLIRVNGFTVLTEEGDMIWSFPPDLPDLRP
ncbi:hypothetical protein A7U43_28200 (plasmid) [Mycobacterium adipatum]|uniref:Uncharacterized protein n=1 Tax=Mycobacterium adipatum TaxID=1682113 RepID=A0A172UWI7_9MYCO|nr:hypothetical protein A7U43_28200 [Mycobacterium adipatum]